MKITAKILWVSLFVVLGYLSYGVSGEASMGWGIIYMLLAFPSSLIVYIIGGVFDFFPPALSDVMGTLFFMSVGYFQWFVALPWLINLIKKAYNGLNQMKDKDIQSPKRH